MTEETTGVITIGEIAEMIEEAAAVAAETEAAEVEIEAVVAVEIEVVVEVETAVEEQEEISSYWLPGTGCQLLNKKNFTGYRELETGNK
jgi:hypothetical protein